MKRFIALLTSVSLLLLMLPTVAVGAAPIYYAADGKITASGDWIYTGCVFSDNIFGWITADAAFSFEVDFGTAGYNTFAIYAAEMYEDWKYTLSIDGQEAGTVHGDASGGFAPSNAVAATLYLDKTYTGIHTVQITSAPNSGGNYKGNLYALEFSISTPIKGVTDTPIKASPEWLATATYDDTLDCYGYFGTYEKLASALVDFGNTNTDALLVNMGHPYFDSIAYVYVDNQYIGTATSPCSSSYSTGTNGFITLPEPLNGVHAISVSTENCNLFSITPHIHRFARNTCIDVGVCSCGAVETAPGHIWLDATCTAAKTCSLCGATDGVPTAHTLVEDAAVAATCITTGLTAGSHCAVCNAIVVPQLTVGITDHTFVDDVCSHCGYTILVEQGTFVTAVTKGDVTFSVYELDTDCYRLEVSGNGVIPTWNTLPLHTTYADKISILSIEEGITTVSYGTFKDMPALEQVTLPSTLTVINGTAFQNDTALSRIYFPNKLTTIGYAAFMNTGLTQVVLPDSVKSMGTWVFANCAKLSSVVLGESKLASKALPARTFSGCSALKSVNFGNRIQIIDDYAFFRCGLEQLHLPANIKTVDNAAFYRCTSLRSVTAADGGITYLGWASFYGCAALEAIQLGDSLTNISTWVFTACHNLKTVTLPPSVTTVGRRTFSWCQGLEQVVLSDGMTDIREGLFYSNYRLKSVTIPSGITAIGQSAFYNCYALTDIRIPAAVTAIGEHAFVNTTALSTVYIESPWVAERLTDAAAHGDLIRHAETVAIRTDLPATAYVSADLPERCLTTADGISYTMYSRQVLPGRVNGVNYDGMYYNNVKHHGAKGDGITDDTDAIQAILNNLSAGSTVFFPAGIYRITSPLRVKEGVHLVGVPAENGIGGSTIKAGKSMDCLIGCHPNSVRFNASIIMNFTFDGGKKDGYTLTSLLDMPGFCSMKMANLKLQNCTGNGIWTYQGSANNPTWISTCENIDVSNVDGWATYMINSDTAFNHITVNGGKGMMDFNYGGNVYNDIYVAGSTGSGLTIGREDKNENGHISIMNSTFKNNARYGLQLNRLSAGDKRLQVEGCDFSGNGQGDVGVKNVARGTFYNCNFRSNTAFASASSAKEMAVVACNMAAKSISGSGFTVSGDTKANVTSFTEKGCVLDTDRYDYATTYKAAALQCVSGDVVDVTAFGAVGNGNTDSANAFRQAIDAVRIRGGIVYVPKGSYLFSQTVKIPSNVTIVGEGNNNSVSYAPMNGVRTVFELETGACNVLFLNANILNTRGGTIDHFIKGDGVKNCRFDSVEGNSNVVDGYKNVIYLSNAANCVFNAVVCGVGDGGNIIYLKDSENCTVQTGYISRGSKGTVVDGGHGHSMFNNHYDWFYKTAVEFLNGATDCVFANNYCDINQRVVTLNYDTVTDANITISTFISRESGIPARNKLITGGNERREIPEIYIRNAKNVQILSCSSDIWSYSTATNRCMLELAGTNDNILVRGCIIGGGKVFPDGQAALFGSNSTCNTTVYYYS